MGIFTRVTNELTVRPDWPWVGGIVVVLLLIVLWAVSLHQAMRDGRTAWMISIMFLGPAAGALYLFMADRHPNHT